MNWNIAVHPGGNADFISDDGVHAWYWRVWKGQTGNYYYALAYTQNEEPYISGVIIPEIRFHHYNLASDFDKYVRETIREAPNLWDMAIARPPELPDTCRVKREEILDNIEWPIPFVSQTELERRLENGYN